MPAQSIFSALHVEDDPVYRHLIESHLKSMPHHHFIVTFAESEEDAVHAFSQQPFDLALVDYHLERGNGLSCVSRIRRIDPIVPIIAISGTASADVAEELLAAGVDDYLDKKNLSRSQFVQAVELSLERSIAWRGIQQRRAGSDQTRKLFHELCDEFSDRLDSQFLQRLNELERAARQEQLDIGTLAAWFEQACTLVPAAQTRTATEIRMVLHPLLLEMQSRVCR